jgi:hypothetical protein
MTEKSGIVERVVAWARAAKAQAMEADLESVPRDESFMRAATAYHMLTRGPYAPVRVVADAASPEGFNRSSAIVMMAISFDDNPPNTPERTTLFATKLEVE